MVFLLIYMRVDASCLSRTCRHIYTLSRSCVWSQYPVLVPMDLVKADPVSFTNKASLVKSVILNLHPTVDIFVFGAEVPFPIPIFPLIRTLHIWMVHNDTVPLHQFLVPSITSLTFAFEDDMRDSVDIPALLERLPELVNLRSCIFNHSAPAASRLIYFHNLPSVFLKLPHPEKLTAFGTRGVGAPSEIFDFFLSLLELTRLEFDARPFTNLLQHPQLELPLYADPLSVLPSPNLLTTLWLRPYELAPFKFESLIPFRNLRDLTVVVHRGESSPADVDNLPTDIDNLHLLPHLEALHVDIYELAKILTEDIFLEFTAAWPDLRTLILIDAKKYRRSRHTVAPISQVRIKLLETLARRCPRLCKVILSVDASDFWLSSPPLAVCRTVDASILMYGIIERDSIPGLEAYLDDLYRKRGSTGRLWAGHLWE